MFTFIFKTADICKHNHVELKSSLQSVFYLFDHIIGNPSSIYVCVLTLQPSSTLSSYVSACAYSPTNQYGVYSGPAGGYVAPGHHHWQPQSQALSHAGSGMGMHAGDIHTHMAFKHQAREGTACGRGRTDKFNSGGLHVLPRLF